ncbi:MAG: hypothetical protein HN348_30115, partial [Proteobacteria bacterium]|nr:hypothetical protein [Pseudomonadota bacterium]
MSSLRSAHKGYQYQDLATAISLVHMLVTDAGSVTVDRKDGVNDKFDDITERTPGVRVSRQLKWTDNEARRLCLADFTGTSSSVRIDLLVASHRELHREPQTEVRLSVRWDHPNEQDLLPLLEEVPAIPPTFDGFSTKRFRLRAERIWPAGSEALWSPLAVVNREDFLTFCGEFIVESGLPQCSRDLSSPGPLESHLFDLLANKVGIGQFPNQSRSVEDVAAR